MICELCAKTAGVNRFRYEEFVMKGADNVPMTQHPDDCGCACQHRMPAQWDKYFSVEQPNG